MNLRTWSPLAVAAVALLAGCGRHADSRAAAALPAVSASVVTADAVDPMSTHPLPGTVRPAVTATVAAKVMGTVTRADVALGQTVKAGDVLVTLSAPEIVARVEQARVGLVMASRDFEREKALLEKGASTAESVRALADRERAAKAALDEAEAMLSYTTLVAPFAGRVSQDFVNVGDLASPGQPLLAIEADGARVIEVAVPESLPVPAIGTELAVGDGDAPEVRARLLEASPAADGASRSRGVKLALPAASTWRSGQFVRVSWPGTSMTQVVVPASAVSVFGQMERVFVVHDGRAALRLIKTAGALPDGRVVVVSGLSAGERVVQTPPAALRDGQEVKP